MACWISLDKNTASKDSTVRLTYDRNTTGEKRTATVEVKSPDGAIVKRYTIVQNEQILEGNDLRTKECTRNCGDGGVSATQTVTVEANTFMAETKEQANALADEELKKKCEAVSPTLTCTWTNDEITRPVQKNDCLVTEEGSLVDWTVEAGKYSSTVSKADANAKAEAEFGPEGEGQENANLHGTCTTTLWYSKEMRESFPVTKCEENFTPVPTEVEYVVPAGKYSWTDTMPPVDGLTGQEAADKQAQNDLEANGPANANLPENSTCKENDFFLGKYSFTYTRDDCAEHFHSPDLFVDQTNTEVPGYPWKSYISQKDADDMAKAAIDEYGNAKIMEMDCIEDQKWVGQFSRPFTKTCPDNGSGSSHVIDATMVEGYPESVTSYESEDVANGLAEAAVLAQGQALADAISSGTCTWIGSHEQQFQRDNCEGDLIGSFVTVSASMTTGYPENSTSTVSAADAKDKATAAVREQGQAIANTQGTCEEGTVYYGFATRKLTRANCPTCEKGVEMEVTSDQVFGVNQIPSTVSQAEADRIAGAKMDEDSVDVPGLTNAQVWVNKYGTCVEDTDLTSTPTWVDTGDTECREGVSFKKQTNTNDCYTGDPQEQWIEGGDRVCQWTGEASLPFTPACNSSYQGTDHKGTASGTITITQDDVTGDFTSIISPEDADAKALAAVTAQGQAIADQRGIASGMCTWKATYTKNYTKNDCGSCTTPAASCTNVAITSTMVNGSEVSSTVSYEDAYNKAVESVTKVTNGMEAGQAKVNKDCRSCDVVSAEANWQPVAGEVDVCDDCTSKRLHRDLAECSTTEGETMLRPYGSKNCSKSGSTWTETSSTRCNGCTPQVLKRNSCGGEEWFDGGSRTCEQWRYYGTGSCDYNNHILYDAYINDCNGYVDNYYRIAETNSIACGYDPCVNNTCSRASDLGCDGTSGYRVYSRVPSVYGCDCPDERVPDNSCCGGCTSYGDYFCAGGISRRRRRDQCGNACDDELYVGTACGSEAQTHKAYTKTSCGTPDQCSYRPNASAGAYTPCNRGIDAFFASSSAEASRLSKADADACIETWINSQDCRCAIWQYKSNCASCGSGCTHNPDVPVKGEGPTANAAYLDAKEKADALSCSYACNCPSEPSTTGTLVVKFTATGTIVAGTVRVSKSGFVQDVSLSGSDTIGTATLAAGTYSLSLVDGRVQARACNNSNTNFYTSNLSSTSVTITAGQSKTVFLYISCPG